MKKILLVGAALSAFIAAPAFAAPQKETRVSTPAPAAQPAPQVVVQERVVVREVPVRVEVPAPRRARTSDAFTGFSVGASVGVADFGNVEDVTYGVGVGLDAPVGDRVVVGLRAGVSDFAEGHRQLGVGARAGVAVSRDVLPYVHAGYARADFDRRSATLDGLTYGAGAEFRLTNRVNLTAEYVRSDFGRGLSSDGASIGFSIGF